MGLKEYKDMINGRTRVGLFYVGDVIRTAVNEDTAGFVRESVEFCKRDKEKTKERLEALAIYSVGGLLTIIAQGFQRDALDEVLPVYAEQSDNTSTQRVVEAIKLVAVELGYSITPRGEASN